METKEITQQETNEPKIEIVDFTCPYCGKIILISNSVVHREYHSSIFSHWWAWLSTAIPIVWAVLFMMNRTDIYYVLQCNECQERRKKKKRIVRSLLLLASVILILAFIIDSEWVFFVSVFVFACLVAYLIVLSIINHKKGLKFSVSKEEAQQKQALTTEPSK